MKEIFRIFSQKFLFAGNPKNCKTLKLLSVVLDYTGKSGGVDTQYGYYYPNSRHDLDLYTNQLGNETYKVKDPIWPYMTL